MIPVVWLTGPPAAGKSTIASRLSALIEADGCRAGIIDGDVLRRGRSQDLGYSKADRDEQVRRAADEAHRLVAEGIVPIVALVSPYRSARDEVRARFPRFIEVHVDCPLGVLIARDPKGQYRDALAGRLPHFTGVSDPYEPPPAPDVHVRSDHEPVDVAARRIWAVAKASDSPAT